jgi:ribonuclease HII
MPSDCNWKFDFFNRSQTAGIGQSCTYNRGEGWDGEGACSAVREKSNEIRQGGQSIAAKESVPARAGAGKSLAQTLKSPSAAATVERAQSKSATREKRADSSVRQKSADKTEVISAAALAKERKNRDRFRKLISFDKKQRASPDREDAVLHLIGTDEVGRGCLAGPVVAAAVILPDIKPGSAMAKSLHELNDSKKLTFPQRERLALILQDICIWAIAEASPAEINEINILHASLLAMKRAITELSNKTKTYFDDKSTLVLIDGNKTIRDLSLGQKAVIDGDAKSASIAAASIIAKVYRDRLMINLSQSFPAFNWHRNKGYGSLTHRNALRQLGMTEWHRRVFCEKILVEQMTLDLDFTSGDESALEELEDIKVLEAIEDLETCSN